MKKMAAFLSLVGLLIFCINAQAESDLTLLVYMCGSDMTEAACEDIREMENAEIGSTVNILILAGGADAWDDDEIMGNTRNLMTIRNGNMESVADWGWASMGSEQSLLKFLEFGLTKYPAQRTAVVLWNHGAGSEAGVCFDATTADQDRLTILEINQALLDLDERLEGFHIDVWGCDACMMATYEMAVMLSHHPIDYYVASEELEPGIGWCYTPWLSTIARNPNITTEHLCQMIVNSYMQAGQEEDPDDYLTLSAIDLNAMEPLQNALENLGAVLHGRLKNGHAADIRRARSQMYTFGSFVNDSWDMVDLGAMLDACARYDPDGAAQARSALANTVLISKQTRNLNPCCGLSVLIPQDTKNEFESHMDGMDLSPYIPNWIGFVKSYAGHLTGGSCSFSHTVPEHMTGTGFLSQINSIFGAQREEWIWNDTSAAYEETAGTTCAFSAKEDDDGFTATLSPDDLQYLDYVEGMMMMAVSDDEMAGYVDLGLMQNNIIDWDTGKIYSLFDGTWPVLGGQLVPLYDQVISEYGRRSLIPIKLNGEYTYLVAEFAPGSDTGRLLGVNSGYDDNGLPIRSTTKLKAGDSIVPVYTIYISAEDSDDLEESEFEGTAILWQEGLNVTYEDMAHEEEPRTMMFCFILNDVFGGYDMTEIIPFEL